MPRKHHLFWRKGKEREGEEEREESEGQESVAKKDQPTKHNKWKQTGEKIYGVNTLLFALSRAPSVSLCLCLSLPFSLSPSRKGSHQRMLSAHLFTGFEGHQEWRSLTNTHTTIHTHNDTHTQSQHDTTFQRSRKGENYEKQHNFFQLFFFGLKKIRAVFFN